MHRRWVQLIAWQTFRSDSRLDWNGGLPGSKPEKCIIPIPEHVPAGFDSLNFRNSILGKDVPVHRSHGKGAILPRNPFLDLVAEALCLSHFGFQQFVACFSSLVPPPLPRQAGHNFTRLARFNLAHGEQTINRSLPPSLTLNNYPRQNFNEQQWVRLIFRTQHQTQLELQRATLTQTHRRHFNQR